MKEKDSKSNKKLMYSILVLGAMVMFAIGASTMMNNEAVIATVEEQITEQVDQDTYSSGTSVEWHGTLDLFVTSAETGEKTQVVFGKPNLITDGGADRIRGHLNGSITDGITIANMSLSDTSDALSTAWTELPVEITTNGLDRTVVAAGLVNNGTGAFNITHTWTASASQDCQTIGLHWDGTDGLDGNLFAALNFTQQSLLVNDQLEAVYSVEIS